MTNFDNNNDLFYLIEHLYNPILDIFPHREMFGAFLIAVVVGYPISNPTPEPLSYFFVYHAEHNNSLVHYWILTIFIVIWRQGVLNTLVPQIHVGLMAGIWASLGLDFGTFTIFYFLLSLFIGNLCFFVTLCNPFLGLTKWFNMPHFIDIKFGTRYFEQQNLFSWHFSCSVINLDRNQLTHGSAIQDRCW